jgi:hypothetical protein
MAAQGLGATSFNVSHGFSLLRAHQMLCPVLLTIGAENIRHFQWLPCQRHSFGEIKAYMHSADS